MNKFGKNTISNIVTKLWNMVSIYLFVPFYIDFLGQEAYGIVSFFATMQMAISLLGLGLANTLQREFAADESENAAFSRKYKLLRSVELIYFGIAVVASLACWIASDTIATGWLNIGDMDATYVANVVTLMGISISIQLVVNIYVGCMFGLNRLVEANRYSIMWSAFKHFGSLLIVWQVSTDLRFFYGWHIFVDLIYTLLLRSKVVKVLREMNKCQWMLSDFIVIRKIWKYALGVLSISLIAFVNKQLDKLIISKYLSLTELGAYNLAVTMGSIPAIFSVAVYASFFPMITGHITGGRKEFARNLFCKVNRSTNLVTICIGAYVAVFAVPLITLWTQVDSYNELLRIAAPFVVLSATMVELQQVPYAFALANGNTKINTAIGFIFIPLVAVVAWFGISRYGLVGAGIASLSMMGLQTLLYEFFVYKKYIDSSPVKRILRDAIAPMLCSLATALLSYWMITRFVSSNTLTVALAVITGAVNLVIQFLLFDRDRILSIVNKKYKRKIGE